jgi:hypothetical protein
VFTVTITILKGADLDFNSPKKRKLNIYNDESKDLRPNELQLVPEKALRAMGYMEVTELKDLYTQTPAVETERPRSPEHYPSEILEALNSIPGKTQTGTAP